MKNKLALLLVLISTVYSHQARCQLLTALNLSHDSTVRITSQSGNSSGSGSMVSDQIALTCFHVVSSLTQQGQNVNWNVFQDLQVLLPSGEVIAGTVISLPTNQNPDPLVHDFAFVKLAHAPSKKATIVQLASDKEMPSLGSDVVFSGFPLNTPGMVSHKGMVSGSNPSMNLIFVEASINKGNSGGALIDMQGRVVGIVSLREGGITPALDSLRRYINQNSANGSVTIMGVNPLASTNAIIDTLDQNISTGIGYAREIRFARDYRQSHADLFK